MVYDIHVVANERNNRSLKENEMTECVCKSDGFSQATTLISPEESEWECYMFGGEDGYGITYRPKKGCEPNCFVRWMMKVCFACTWVKGVTS